MTPAYFAENPEASLPKKPSPLNRISAKTLAARVATERRVPFSTIKKQQGSTPQKPGKAIPKKNAKREVKRRASYAKKLAAYRKSETYKVVEQRAGGRCEQWFVVEGGGFLRCSVYVNLQHHHLTYGAAGSRFGGKELPEDIRVLCKHHHDEAEAKARPWNRNRARA